MPLATPKSGEDRQEFIQRCMRDSVMVNEFPDEDQRYAICVTQAKTESFSKFSSIFIDNKSFIKTIMNKEQLKELVKAHFNLVDAPQPTEEKFGEIADINKAFIIKFPGETLEVGTPVTVKTEEGQEAPAPNGYHTLEDGKVIKVEDGVVKEIESKEEAGSEEIKEDEEMKKEEMSAKDPGDEQPEKEEVVETTEPEVSLEEVVKEVMSAVMAEVNVLKEELKLAKEEFARTPASTKTLPIPTPTVNHSFDIESAANADRIKLALEQIKNKKK
jgi:hypothetical protein